MKGFEEIFREYHHQLLLYSLKFVDNENDAGDIVQEVFASLWEKQKVLDENSSIKSYLYSATRNSCLNFLKHKKVVKKHEEHEARVKELEHFSSSEKSLIEKEDIQKIHQAINALTDQYKEVIRLSRFEGLKNKQIAEKLDIPVRTVETRLFRALSKLRKSLTEKQIFILLNYPFWK